MTTTAQSIFEAMKRIVEAPGYPLLQAYKDDFYKRDLEQLVARWNPKSRAIWVVTPNGTHLNFIGHHPKQIEGVQAAVDSGYRDIEIYLLSAKGATPVTRERAISEAQNLDFKVKDHCVFNKAGDKLAMFEIEPYGQMYRNRACVHFTSASPTSKDAFVLSALVEIAIQENIIACSSLFSGVTMITLDHDVVVGSCLVPVKTHRNEHQFVVCRIQKGDNEPGFSVLDRGNAWASSIEKAQLFDAKPRQFADQTSFVLTKLRAAQHLAQEAHFAMAA